jgi:hypothetical protein
MRYRRPAIRWDETAHLCAGLFFGTSLVNTGRLSVGAKSVTGGIKGNGGTVAFSCTIRIAAVVLEAGPLTAGRICCM